MFLQINMVKYDADWEITNIYENLQIVWSQFFTDILLFIYIRSTSNIYWFISIQIFCEWIQTNSYLVTFDYLQYLVQHSMNNPEGKKTSICCYLIINDGRKWCLKLEHHSRVINYAPGVVNYAPRVFNYAPR